MQRSSFSRLKTAGNGLSLQALCLIGSRALVAADQFSSIRIYRCQRKQSPLTAPSSRPLPPKASSTGKLLELISSQFKEHDIETEIIHLADHDIKPGVTSDEGGGDAWPKIREKVLEADILIIGTPIWLGQPSSICKRALERMDAFLEETDARGRMVSYGKVAAVAVVGNEDGAHHVSAEIFQALNDVGFTIPANAVAYWVGEAMGSTNFVDLDEVPDAVNSMITALARNTAHLSGLLSAAQYPGEEK